MFWSKNKNGFYLSVHIFPRSAKTQIVGEYNNSLKIKLKSPPVDNAANEELIKFLSDKINVPRSNIQIVRGHNSKRKILSVAKITEEKLKRLAVLI